MIIHTVSAGETLFSIASRYGVSADRLSFDNDISSDLRLPVGAALAVAIPTLTHTVSQGETLLSVARLYGVAVKELWRQNLFLNGSERILPGQTLYIKTERTPIGAYQTGGYAYTNIPRILLDRTLPLMSAAIPFTYGFTDDGELVSPDDALMLERSAYYGCTPVMHLSTLTGGDTFSPTLAAALFKSPEAEAALIENIVSNINTKGYGALDIDFEFLGRENAQPYARFVTKSRERLNNEGYGVMTALAPKISVGQPGVLYEGHDYAALGNAANALLLMTYEWGYTAGPPMAVSPLPQVERVVRFAVTQITPQKLFLGISNYGYDFTLPYVRGVSRAPSVSTARAIEIASQNGAEIRYDSTVQAPFFEYSDGEKDHIVWFEDVRSISARLSLLPRFGLRGALYWNLNRRNNQNLVLLSQTVDIADFSLL